MPCFLVCGDGEPYSVQQLCGPRPVCCSAVHLTDEAIHKSVFHVFLRWSNTWVNIPCLSYRWSDTQVIIPCLSHMWNDTQVCIPCLSHRRCNTQVSIPCLSQRWSDTQTSIPCLMNEVIHGSECLHLSLVPLLLLSFSSFLSLPPSFSPPSLLFLFCFCFVFSPYSKHLSLSSFPFFFTLCWSDIFVGKKKRQNKKLNINYCREERCSGKNLQTDFQTNKDVQRQKGKTVHGPWWPRLRRRSYRGLKSRAGAWSGGKGREGFWGRGWVSKDQSPAEFTANDGGGLPSACAD